MTKENLQVLFDTHPTVNEFFFTSDDQAFFTKNAADNHGQKLSNKAVTSVLRSNLTPVHVFDAGELNTSEDEILAQAAKITAKRELIAKMRAAGTTAANGVNAENTGEGTNEGAPAPEMINHTITEEDLANMPELAEAGVKVGDVIQIPADDDTSGAPVKSALEIAIETPEAERTSIQKGLITKAANAAKKAEGSN